MASNLQVLIYFSDFLIKVVDLETSNQKLFQEHEAPVLSLAIHPDETYMVLFQYQSPS